MDKAQMYVFIGVGAAAIFIVLIFIGIIPGLPGTDTQPASLVMWGFQDKKIWEQIFQRYGSVRPNIKISYSQKNPVAFEAELLNALAQGQAPDIIMFPAEYLKRQGDKIALAPKGVITEKDLGLAHIDATRTLWVPSQQTIRGIPIYGDTLVLYSNKALLTKYFIPSPPATWDELVVMAKKITQKDASGNISIAGVAMGRARNIQNASDIIAALFLQFGDPMTDDRGRMDLGSAVKRGEVSENAAESALQFFTDFANPRRTTYSWSVALPEAQEFFITGKLAFYLGYISEYNTIRAKNPHLDIVVSLFPQLSGAERPVTSGSITMLAVPRFSRNQTHAWNFIYFAAQPAQAGILANATNNVIPRRDTFSLYQNEAVRSVFAKSMLALRLWSNPSPAAVRSAFRDMIEDVAIGRRSIKESVDNANTQINNRAGI